MSDSDEAGNVQLVKQSAIIEQKEDLGEHGTEEKKDIEVITTEEINPDDLLIPVGLGPRHSVMNTCDVVLIHYPLPSSHPVHGVLFLDAPYTANTCIQRQSWEKPDEYGEFKSSGVELCEFIPIIDGKSLSSSIEDKEGDGDKRYMSDSSDDEYELLRKRRVQHTMHYWNIRQDFADSKRDRSDSHSGSSDDEKDRDRNTHTQRRRFYSSDDEKKAHDNDSKESSGGYGGNRHRLHSRDDYEGYRAERYGDSSRYGNRYGREDDMFAAESKTSGLRLSSTRYYDDIK